MQQLQNRLCDFCLYGCVVALSIEYYEKNSYKAAGQAQKYCKFLNKIKWMRVLEGGFINYWQGADEFYISNSYHNHQKWESVSIKFDCPFYSVVLGTYSEYR